MKAGGSFISTLQLILACGSLSLLTGCSTTLVRLDHEGLRHAMMRYTEDQIMDNVIRARKGYPIMHFDVNDVSAEVTTGLKLEGMGGQTLLNKLASVGSEITRPLTISPSANRDNHVTLSMKPVLLANEVYTAYIAFVNLDKIDTPDCDRVLLRNNHPKKEEVHIGRWFTDPNGVREYWYVPKTPYAQEAFFYLAMRTAVQRGEDNPKIAPIQFPSAGGKITPGSRGNAKVPHGSSKLPAALIGPSYTPDRFKRGAGDSLEDVVRELRSLRLR